MGGCSNNLSGYQAVELLRSWLCAGCLLLVQTLKAWCCERCPGPLLALSAGVLLGWCCCRVVTHNNSKRINGRGAAPSNLGTHIIQPLIVCVLKMARCEYVHGKRPAFDLSCPGFVLRVVGTLSTFAATQLSAAGVWVLLLRHACCPDCRTFQGNQVAPVWPAAAHSHTHPGLTDYMLCSLTCGQHTCTWLEEVVVLLVCLCVAASTPAGTAVAKPDGRGTACWQPTGRRCALCGQWCGHTNPGCLQGCWWA